MDFIVCLKQIVDLQQVRIKKDTREPVLEGLPFLFSDMDMNALEAAVGIREKDGGKVVALCIGNAKLKDTIKDALARGAEEAVLIIDPISFDTHGFRGQGRGSGGSRPENGPLRRHIHGRGLSLIAIRARRAAGWRNCWICPRLPMSASWNSPMERSRPPEYG